MKKKQLVRFLFSASLFLWAGCTEVDVKYPPEPVPETESGVVITPSVAMPTGTKYYFYPVTGGEPAILDAKDDGSLESELPFGTYRLLAVDADSEDVEFRGMTNLETAGVYLKSEAQPDDVYLLTIDEVVVEEGKTATYGGTPTLLTHNLTLSLDLSAISETVTGVSGTLNGFYPGVLLAGGTPVVTDAGTTKLAFSDNAVVSRANPDGYPVTIRSFGLLNPRLEGHTYNSTLALEVTTASGTYPANVDLTAALADQLDKDGNLPSNVVIPVEVDDPTPVDPSTESSVVITPSTAMTAGTKYYFYNKESGLATSFNALPNGTLSGKLKFGTYRLLAVTADAAGIEFRGMESLGTAAAYLKNGVALTGASVLSIDEVVVEADKVAAYEGTPRLLTHTLKVDMDIIGGDATAISGTLNGFFPGVSLSSGKPINTGASTNTLSFTATLSGSSAFVSIPSLGVLNPSAAGHSYTSLLQLQVSTASGTISKNVELSAALSAAADASGTIPTGAQVSASVNLGSDPEPEDPTPSNPTGGAEDWGTGEGHEGDLK